MLRKLSLFASGLLIGATFSLSAAVAAGPFSIPAGDSASVVCQNGVRITSQRLSNSELRLQCAALPATATVPPATATPAPTNTPGASVGWHPNGSHAGATNLHEHGDPVPSWLVGFACVPFSQTRESHTGYKGVEGEFGGVRSYLVTHILSTIAARSHGDHDYQLFMLESNGNKSCWEGVLDFGNPPPLRTSDTGERPIILSVGDGGCETWYNRPGAAVTDLGWTICNRYQNFAGVTTGGAGHFRTMDWAVYGDRLPGPHVRQISPTLAGACNFACAFIKSSVDYGPAEPIN